MSNTNLKINTTSVSATYKVVIHDKEFSLTLEELRQLFFQIKPHIADNTTPHLIPFDPMTPFVPVNPAPPTWPNTQPFYPKWPEIWCSVKSN